tara:strand:+ start:7389 stop:7946 length:558 start_codon:yes stop_codon:yes gene_type:complete
LVKVTDKDVVEVKEMLHRIAVDQFDTHGEVAPFFAVIGDREPKNLEQVTKQGGLPLHVTEVNKASPDLKLPVLVGIYLHGIPKSLWQGLMQATARDVNATALMFSVESWIVPTFESKQAVDEWFDEHDSLSEHPDAEEQVQVSTNWRDGTMIMERALIHPITRKLTDWEDVESDEVDGRFAGLKW